MAARVVPQDAGTQHLVRGIEQGGAVHLAGKADALDRGQLSRMGSLQLGDRRLAGLDPLRRILLRPARVRPRDVEGSVAGADDLLAIVDQQRLDA